MEYISKVRTSKLLPKYKHVLITILNHVLMEILDTDQLRKWGEDQYPLMIFILVQECTILDNFIEMMDNITEGLVTI